MRPSLTPPAGTSEDRKLYRWISAVNCSSDGLPPTRPSDRLRSVFVPIEPLPPAEIRFVTSSTVKAEYVRASSSVLVNFAVLNSMGRGERFCTLNQSRMRGAPVSGRNLSSDGYPNVNLC